MSYTKTNWVNDTEPAINADNLNKIEQGIKDNSDAIGDLTDLETSIQTDLVNAINEVNSKSEVDDTYGTSTSRSYSQNYQNKHNVVISSTTPSTNERVWFKKGKNLFNFNYSETNLGITSTYSSSTLSLNGSGTAAGYNLSSPSTKMIKLPAGSYVISFSLISGSKTGAQSLIVRNADNNNNIIDTSFSIDSTYTFTLTNETNIAVLIYIGSSNQFSNYKIGIQIEEGSTSTSYEEYKNPSISVDGYEVYNRDDFITTEWTTDSGGFSYRKVNGINFLKFNDKQLTSTGWNILGTIPSDMRPLNNFYSTATVNQTPCQCLITTAGSVRIYNSLTITDPFANGFISWVK